MKYKLTLSIILGILLIAGVIAGGVITAISRDVIVDKPIADSLVTKGITEIQKGQMTCDGEKCWIHLYKANVINTEIITSATKDLTTCARPVCQIVERAICQQPVCEMIGEEVCQEPICDEKGNCEKPICELIEREVCQQPVCEMIGEEVCDEPVCTTTRVTKTKAEIVADLDNEFNKRMIDVNNQLTPRTLPIADTQDTATAITIKARTVTPITEEPILGEEVK